MNKWDERGLELARCVAGVVRVVCPAATPELAARWGESLAESERMFAEAGVELVIISPARAAHEPELGGEG